MPENFAPRTGVGPGHGAERRLGVTIPLDGVSLAEHRGWFARLADLGYTDVWSSEVDGSDGFTPLALAAAWEPRLHLGLAIAPVFTRGPALLAMSIAALAEVAGDRLTIGLGASSAPVVERWNGIPYQHPYARTRDVLHIVQRALAGERIDEELETLTVRGFRLSRPVTTRPRLILGALRPGMLHLARDEADGAVLNWLSVGDVGRVRQELGDAFVAARLFVIPTADAERARTLARRMIATYLTVPAYADFHRWLGRGPQLEPLWAAWAAGDRAGANAAIPDEVVDALIIHGAPEACREHIARYQDAGVDAAVLAVISPPDELAEAVARLAPR